MYFDYSVSPIHSFLFCIRWSVLWEVKTCAKNCRKWIWHQKYLDGTLPQSLVNLRIVLFGYVRNLIIYVVLVYKVSVILLLFGISFFLKYSFVVNNFMFYSYSGNIFSWNSWLINDIYIIYIYCTKYYQFFIIRYVLKIVVYFVRKLEHLH